MKTFVQLVELICTKRPQDFFIALLAMVKEATINFEHNIYK